jgi:hypothetical protein
LFPDLVDPYIDGYYKHHNRASTAADAAPAACRLPRWKSRRLEDSSNRDGLDDVMAQNKVALNDQPRAGH